MAYNLKGRTVANDNIAVGAPAGRERTLAGGVLPPPERVGSKDNIAVATPFGNTVCADNMNPGVVTILVERRTP